jgi:hypothetical protein
MIMGCGQKYETGKTNGKTEKFRFVMLFGFTLNKMIGKSVSSQIVGSSCRRENREAHLASRQAIKL